MKPAESNEPKETLMLKRLLVVALVAAAAPVLADQKPTAVAAVQKFDIDTMHTQASFTYDHFGFSNPTGRLEQIKGSIELNQQDWGKSKVSVTMPLSGLHTGVEKLDAHLKSADFFDAEKNPDITFKSTKVEKTGEKTLKVTGDMTAHGVTKPVTLDVKINKIGENKMMATQSAGFEADAHIKRSDWGVAAYAPAVSDEVHIHLTVSADLAK
jgi:polyisoprenoid-binding protein YceI